jgi:hypothetical protein
MALYTDRDVRDAKLIKTRVTALLERTNALRHNHYDKLDLRTDKDLVEVTKLLQGILDRH